MFANINLMIIAIIVYNVSISSILGQPEILSCGIKNIPYSGRKVNIYIYIMVLHFIDIIVRFFGKHLVWVNVCSLMP